MTNKGHFLYVCILCLSSFYNVRNGSRNVLSVLDKWPLNVVGVQGGVGKDQHWFKVIPRDLQLYGCRIQSIIICNSVRLFVCLFAFGAKSMEQNVTKLSGIIKWGSRSVLHGLKSPVLQFLKRYPSISGFSFAADGHFLNYHSLTFGIGRFDSLLIKFKLGRRYSSYPPRLTVQILRISLGPTRRSRSPLKAGALLVSQ